MTNIAPARQVAFTVVRRVFEEGAWADRTLPGEADRAGLDARDRALATRLAYGTVQRARALDHQAQRLAGRDPAGLDPEVRTAIRLGLYQLTYLDHVPAHAAVDESVELTRAAGSKGGGLVNAVLRRATRELPDEPGEETAEAAALTHSVPDWLARLWFDQLGAERARSLLQAINEPAEPALRANTLVTTRDALQAALPVGSTTDDRLPEALVLTAPFDAHGDPGHAAGRYMPQSRAAMLVSRVLAPKPGDRVLDLCAAPGGKTTHLAALSGGEAESVAVERHAGRAEALRRTVERMRAPGVTVDTADAAAPRTDGPFDRVLVDPPCSGLGTLQARPDQRWRIQPGDLDTLAARQTEILAAGAAALAPGGTLVYATCTLNAQENEAVVENLLATRDDLGLDDLQADHRTWHHPIQPRHLLTLPDRDGTAGFFVARLCKSR